MNFLKTMLGVCMTCNVMPVSHSIVSESSEAAFSYSYDEIMEIALAETDEENVISESVVYEDDYAFIQTVESDSISETEEVITMNVTARAYDPIGQTFSQGLYNAQFIVYCQNSVNSGVTFRKPVYYTQQIVSFDSGLGNPASMTTTAKFVGVWGPVGDPQNYGAKTTSSLTTTSTNSGTRYTGFSEYFAVSMTNSCTFTISVLWNVKGGTQKTLSNTFTLY